MTAETVADPPRQHHLRPAALTLFGLLVASQIAITVFAWWEPAFDGTIRYDDIAPISDAYWPMNALLGGPGYALGTITTTVFLAVLGLGSRLNLLGCVLYLLAGVVFALVITAEVLPFAWAADTSIIGEQPGRELFAQYNEHFDAFLPYILGSMALTALGALLAVVGAARCGTLAWWVPALALLIVVALFALPLGSPLAVVVDLAQRALWIYIGLQGLRTLLDRA